MASTLSTEWRPPRIIGEVPAGYSGPVYYRQITTSGSAGPKWFAQSIVLERRKIGKLDFFDRLAAMDSLFKARREYPEMFDTYGALITDWLEPLKARKKSSFPKRWDHLNPGFLELMSDRVRKVVEDLEPNQHLFIPIQIEPDDGNPSRVHVFKTGNGGLGYCALDPEYNPTGGYFADIPQKQTTEFILLDASRIGGWHWFNCEVGIVKSKDMVEKLGDVLPDRVFLVPMGVR